MKRVVILETQLVHYRVSFFVQLASALREHGISLVVGYSGGDGELPSPLGVDLPVHTRWNGRLVVQDAWRLVRDAELVIVSQENRLLFNYVLLALSRLGVKRVAYWGHGFNHQAERSGGSEWLKRRLLSRVDWWFAYTPSVARYLERHGVRSDHLTVVHNTIDVEAMRAAVAAADVTAARARLAIAPDARIGIYCGALSRAKQLGFVVDAAAEIRRLVPAFELIVVGDGPERTMLEAIAHYRPFVHVVGPAFGAARAGYFKLAEVSLLPAHAGLGIVDAFAAGVPVATTDRDGHGPEREYLRTGINSITTPFDVGLYARGIAALLADRDELVRGARATASELPMQRMVAAFATGVVRCLEQT
jgi:L-malate glycosyltransferase